MLTWILLIAVVLSLIISITLFVFLRKAIGRIDFFEKWTEEFLQRTFLAHEELKRIDASGHFEADDEVGYFFKTLKELMQRLFEMGVINEEEIEEQKQEVKTKIDVESLNKAISQKRVGKKSEKEKE
jgi:hypothetical protein